MRLDYLLESIYWGILPELLDYYRSCSFLEYYLEILTFIFIFDCDLYYLSCILLNTSVFPEIPVMCSLIRPAVWQKTDQKHDSTTGIHWNFLWAASSDPFTELTHTSPSPWLSSAIKSSPMALPNHYSGSLEDCSDIYLQCELYMPDQFITDVSKISFIISLLDGKALSWAECIWVAGGSLTSTLRLFLEHFRGVFGQKTDFLSRSLPEITSRPLLHCW